MEINLDEIRERIKWVQEEIPDAVYVEQYLADAKGLLAHIDELKAEVDEWRAWKTGKRGVEEYLSLQVEYRELHTEAERYKRLFHAEHDIANALQEKADRLEAENERLRAANGALDRALNRYERAVLAATVTIGSSRGWDEAVEFIIGYEVPKPTEYIPLGDGYFGIKGCNGLEIYARADSILPAPPNDSVDVNKMEG